MSTPDTSGAYSCVTIPANPGQPSTLPSLVRTALYGWEASAVSDTTLSGAVELLFTIQQPMIGGVIGLVAGDFIDAETALVPEDIAGGFYFSQDSYGRPLFQVIEFGVTRTSPTQFFVGDEFRVTQADDVVRYYFNGTLLRKSLDASVGGDIRVGCTLYASGDQFPSELIEGEGGGGGGGGEGEWKLLEESSMAYTFDGGAEVSLVGSHALCDPVSAPDPFGADVSEWAVSFDAPGVLMRITPVSYTVTNPWATGTGPGAVYHAGALFGDETAEGESTQHYENEAAPWPATNFDGTNDVIGWQPETPLTLYVTSGAGVYSVGYAPGFGSDGRHFWEHFDFQIEVFDTGGGGGGTGTCFWTNLIGVEQDC